MARKRSNKAHTTSVRIGIPDPSLRAVCQTQGVSIGVSRSRSWCGTSFWSGDDFEIDAARDAAAQAAFFADNDLACCLEIAITAVGKAFEGSGELRCAPRLQAVLDELRALRSEVSRD